MNVDSALTLAGMSLQLLGGFVGLVNSNVGKGTRAWLARWARLVGTMTVYLGLIMLCAAGVILLFALQPPFSEWARWTVPDAWPLALKLVVVIGGMIAAVPLIFIPLLAITLVTTWSFDHIPWPKNKEQIEVLLGISAFVFGLGVVLQLIAVATP